MKHVQIFSLETNIQKPNASSASLLPNDACFPVSTFLGSFADTNPPRFRLEETRSNPYTKSPSLCAPPHTFGSYFDRKSNSFPRLSHLRKGTNTTVPYPERAVKAGRTYALAVVTTTPPRSSYQTMARFTVLITM